MAAIAYLRVSSTDQNLIRQEAMAKEIGAEKVFSEKLSGKDTNRPALKAMLNYVREGDVLHVESISRLARSTKDLLNIVEKLTEKKVQFVSHKESIDTTTPTGRFVLTVFAAIAELERESTALRRDEGIKAARDAGVRFGRPPIKLTHNFGKIVAGWKDGSITAAEAIRQTGLTRTTFYRLSKTVR